MDVSSRNGRVTPRHAKVALGDARRRPLEVPAKVECPPRVYTFVEKKNRKYAQQALTSKQSSLHPTMRRGHRRAARRCTPTTEPIRTSTPTNTLQLMARLIGGSARRRRAGAHRILSFLTNRGETVATWRRDVVRRARPAIHDAFCALTAALPNLAPKIKSAVQIG